MQPAYSRKLNPKLKDEEILPASLSKELLQGLLRKKLAFNGLIVTDATTMAGYMMAMARKDAAPHSIAAGADMFLFNRNVEEDYRYMLQGVKNGMITPQRLDEAVTRILATKAALNLHLPQPELDMSEANDIIGCEEHRRWARECADAAITLVKQQEGVLPLTREKYKRILSYPIEPSEAGVSQYTVRAGACQSMLERLRAEGFSVDVFTPASGSEGHTPPGTTITEKYDLIVYVANLSTRSNQTTVRIEWTQPMGANCPLYHNEVPTIFISVENPYHLLDVPRVRTFINTYCSTEEVLEKLTDKLMGRSPFKGKSPVDPFCGKWDARL